MVFAKFQTCRKRFGKSPVEARSEDSLLDGSNELATLRSTSRTRPSSWCSSTSASRDGNAPSPPLHSSRWTPPQQILLNLKKIRQALIFRQFSFILPQDLIFRKYLFFKKKTSVTLHTCIAPGILVLSRILRPWNPYPCTRPSLWTRGARRAGVREPRGVERRGRPPQRGLPAGCQRAARLAGSEGAHFGTFFCGEEFPSQRNATREEHDAS